MKDEALICYKDVEIRRDENVILREVNLELNKGEFLYIIGKVGSGKSTLLKTIYGDMPLSEGTGTVFDYDLRKIKQRQIPFLRRKLGVVFQDFQLLTDRSIEDNLKFVLKATGLKNVSDMERRIEDVLYHVGMENKGYKYPHELSGGEQQRMVIARALLNSPDIILADEPTGNLDPETSKKILQLLHNICNMGTSVIMSTHNYHLVQMFPGKIKKCHKGFFLDFEMDSI